MKIKWNEITWYSKLIAVLLFVGLVSAAFVLGLRYGYERAYYDNEARVESGDETVVTTPEDDEVVNDGDDSIDQDIENEEQGSQIAASDEGFEATATYVGSSTWSYTLAGYLPTPCHSVETEVLVAESYPEQVRLVVEVTPPAPDMMCIQVIEPIELEGEYNASENASFELQVARS